MCYLPSLLKTTAVTTPGDVIDKIWQVVLTQFLGDPVRCMMIMVFYFIGLIVRKNFFTREFTNNSQPEFSKSDKAMALILGLAFFLGSSLLIWIICLFLGTADFGLDANFFTEYQGTITILPGGLCGFMVLKSYIRSRKIAEEDPPPEKAADEEEARLKEKMNSFKQPAKKEEDSHE